MSRIERTFKALCTTRKVALMPYLTMGYPRLESALDLYKLDNYTYPTTDQGLEALVTKPSSDPVPANWKADGYIKKLRKDPWQRDYLYSNDEGDVRDSTTRSFF